MSFEHFDEADFNAVRHLLPDSVMEMVGLIGAEMTLALLRAYGGTSFPVSCNKTPGGRATHAALSEVVGEGAADKLCLAFGPRQRLWMPKCDGAIRELTHRKIRRQFDELVNKDGMAAFWAVQSLAQCHKLTDRSIWNILKKTDSSPPETPQRPLF